MSAVPSIYINWRFVLNCQCPLTETPFQTLIQNQLQNFHPYILAILDDKLYCDANRLLARQQPNYRHIVNLLTRKKCGKVHFFAIRSISKGYNIQSISTGKDEVTNSIIQLSNGQKPLQSIKAVVNYFSENRNFQELRLWLDLFWQQALKKDWFSSSEDLEVRQELRAFMLSLLIYEPLKKTTGDFTTEVMSMWAATILGKEHFLRWVKEDMHHILENEVGVALLSRMICKECTAVLVDKVPYHDEITSIPTEKLLWALENGIFHPQFQLVFQQEREMLFVQRCFTKGSVKTNPSQAAKHAQTVLSHNPNDAVALYVMGVLYEDGADDFIEDRRKARKYFELAHATEPENTTVIRALSNNYADDKPLKELEMKKKLQALNYEHFIWRL